MKRLIILLGTTIVLTSCTGTSSSTPVACEQQYWNSAVAVCLPKGWKPLSRETLETLGVPEETIAAFQFETPHAGQFDTVTVTREPLSEDVKTPAYSAANVLAVSTLPEYALIDKQAVTIDGEEATLHVFSARANPDEPVRRYYQVSAASGRMGYTFTGSFPLSIGSDEAEGVLFILRSVSLKDPKVAEH